MKPEPGPAPPAAPARLPISAERLFGHYDLGALDLRQAAPFLIGRLLEDGDAADLRWLAGTYPETELTAWLTRHGERALSARSLAFWRTVLGDRSADPTGCSARTFDLWPL